MTRVLHVSDLHFGPPAVLAQIDAIEGMIADRGFDVVAVSGDVTQRARAGEFQRAVAFLRDARRHSEVIVVPGNHDVRWWLAPLGIGGHDRIWGPYRRWIGDGLEPVLHVPGATFVGLNTSQGVTVHTLTTRLRDISIIGDVRPEQLDRLAARFDAAPRGDARVVVMHHNPTFGELSQRYGVRHTPRLIDRLCSLGVDLVLCGHDHQEAVALVEREPRGVIVATAGTVSDRSRQGRPSSVHVIDIDPAQIGVRTHLWSEATQSFEPGAERCFKR